METPPFNPPIIIHYGLNDSHSRDWVQENNEGIIGISYFQRSVDSTCEGTLIYKTINLDESCTLDSVTSGIRLEKSVLLYDSFSNPHIFVARSNNIDQVIDHYSKNESDLWQVESLLHFNNEGGKFIYELSAEKGPDNSFHLLILKSRSDINSGDYWDAWINSYLYHLTNASGQWENELIRNFNMAYTEEGCIKSTGRHDFVIDGDGYLHVTFGEQLLASNDASRLWYGTNKSGNWVFELAFINYFGLKDDPGWYPSICLDTDGIPYISCMYVNRVLTRSAIFCKLYLLKRLSSGNWQYDVIADSDDGYYGNDGRRYTGGMSHLVIDGNNVPHIIFSDIASSHYMGYNKFNKGNIRHAVLENEGWNISTIYRQPLPVDYFHATEIHGMSLVISEERGKMSVIGQEMVITGENQYENQLINVEIPWNPTGVTSGENSLPTRTQLSQNYPNPFNPVTTIKYNVPRKSKVSIDIFNILGQKIIKLVEEIKPVGEYHIIWNGNDSKGQSVSTGVYSYRFQAGEYIETKKMILLR